MSKTAGCFGIIILLVALAWIADMAGCNKPEETEAEKAAKEMAGPNNPIVQRIKSLTVANAYSAGYNDGMRKVASMAQKFSTMQGDMVEQLRNAADGKNSFFDLVALVNNLDPAVLSDYRRGWNAGWNTMQPVR